MSETSLPHAILYESDGAYRPRIIRYQHRQGDSDNTSVFQKVYKDGTILNCVVGGEALGLVKPRQGADKYEPQYFDVYLCGVLSKLYPDGHDNIVLSVAHPPDALGHLEQIGSILGGKHTIIRPDGVKVHYSVKAIVPIDEPAGGAIRAMTSELRENSDLISVGDEFLVADFGGKISSIVQCRYMEDKSIKAFFNRDAVFEVGINDVKSEMNEILRFRHPTLFTRKVNEALIDEIIRNRGTAFLAGQRHDFTEEFQDASRVMLTAIENVYESVLNRAYTARFAFVTGGGGGLLFDVVRNTIFKQMSFLADYPNSIEMANARGAHYALRQTINNAQHLASYKKILSKPAALVTFDGGNSKSKGVSSDYQ
jgi:hypothetical protein